MNKDELIAKIIAVPPQHAAILPSEMLLFCKECMSLGVEHVIESGRRYGYSTEVLCQLDWRVTSIEHDPDWATDRRLRHYQNLTMFRCTAQKLLDGLIVEDERTAVLLDGPKGLVAYNFIGAKNRRRDIRVIGIHDTYPGTPVRKELERAEPTVVFSDNRQFLAQYGWMDGDMLRYRGYKSHDELLPIGNVLAVFKGRQ